LIPGSASISAVSPLRVTAVVGTRVAALSVVVKDAEGNPLAGAIVRFSITAGGGTLSDLAARTNSSGIASVASWTLGTVAGMNAVAAIIEPLQPIRFEVVAVAGPPVSVTKVEGDQQIAARGSAVFVRPRVMVTDTYRNAVSGVPVRFAIGSGGGTVSGGDVSTDSLGTATPEGWILGSSGAQKIIAMVEGLTPVIFEATTFEFPEACATIGELTERTTVDSELSVHGCQGADGRFLEYYSIRVASAGALQFKIGSSEFNTRLEIRSGTGIPIATSRPAAGKTDSEITAFLPAGTFVLVASSTDADATGHYHISSADGRPDVGGCEVGILRGYSTLQFAGSQRCSSGTARPTDQYRIYLAAGAPLSIVLDDYSLSYNLLEIRDDDGKTLATGLAKDYVESTLDFTPPVAGYYVIAVQAEEKYEMFVR